MRRVRGPEIASFLVGPAQSPPPAPPLVIDAPAAFKAGYPRNVEGGVDVYLELGPLAAGMSVPFRATAVFSPVVVPAGADLEALLAAGYPTFALDVAGPLPYPGSMIDVPIHAAGVPEAAYHLVTILDHAD